MARSYFGVVNAVGRRFRPEADLDGWIEVVGVARDTGTSDPMGDLVDPHPYLFYRSHVQWRVAPTAVVARTSAGAAPLVAAMQRELRGIDPELPVITAQTMRQSLERSRANIMMAALFLGVLGLIGLGLASIGLYAVVAFTVSRRSREIGIRMALGARQGRVVGDVARQVAALVGVGTLVGLALSIVAVRALGAVAAPAPGVQLYVPSVDPLALTAIAALMAIVGSLAGFVPARRAARLDPAAALKRQA
jgi:ABC-type antimicrobial peptide transport system permease subunit